MTIERMIELLEIEHECMLRCAHDDCDRKCANCELVQEDDELHEMYTNVVRSLKDQEYKDRMFHALEDDWKAMLKEREWNMLTEDADGFINGLPGDDGQYLMTDGEEIWIDDYVDGVDDGVWLDSGCDIREIKAWMYMPELPKKDRR